MGDLQCGLVFRTSKYYNNKEFSDVEFIIKDGIGCTIIYAHKQILSMASSVFATLFSEKPQPKVQIKINEFGPRIVNLVLSYLYTDELILKGIDEAVDVLKLSEKFGIHELKVHCRKYISLDNISLENVLTVYEIALKENDAGCLKKCQELVSRQTAAVMALPRFRETSVDVIKDILKRNSLSVKENELLLGLMTWIRRDCEKRGRPTENVCLRDSLSPLLPYIRILTLSIEDLCDFVENYGLFTSTESIKLTQKILEPDAACTVPPGFCSNATPRSKPDIPNVVSARKMHENNNIVSKNNSKEVPYSKFPQDIPNVVSARKMLENNNIVSKNNSKEVPYSKFPQAPIHKSPAALSRKKTSPPHSLDNLSIDNSAPPVISSQNGVWDDNLNSPEKPLFQFTSASSIPPPQRRPLMLKVVNNQAASNSRKTYDFPLQEIYGENRGLNAVCVSDLICSAELKCTKGSVAVIGVELKISQKQNEDSIKVHTHISGDVPEVVFEKHYKHINNMVQIIFPDSLKLNSTVSSVAQLEITIEDMKLDRCSVCRVADFEINSGLNMTTLVRLKSNQPNQGDGFFFSISRLLYSCN